MRTLLLFGLTVGFQVFGQGYDPTTRPDPNRFAVIPVTSPYDLDEPMSFEVLRDGRIFFIERKGAIKVFDPSVQAVRGVGALSVNTVGNHEQGLVGMTVDPGFEENGWMYLYYFHPTEVKAIVSRYTIKQNLLVANSEVILMEWPAQRETCCHTGGGMTWDGEGNLLITTGNNRGNHLAAHTDERPGREAFDDQGGTANSNSLEGKILRIHPEADGTYSIPAGNLFPPGTRKARPEIFSMGHRNAWRVSVDRKTGFVYWGEVGPDGRQDSDIGPKGYDEFNQARGPGFFGWPYFVGESAFPVYDYEKQKPAGIKDRHHPLNLSPNNTGIVELPPLAPSFVYYPYDQSDLFPELGTGGRSATGGPIFRRADFLNPTRLWPEYYEGKWIVAELSRRLLMVISMKENGDYLSMERLLPDYRPVEPIDIKFGPDGNLYVLEYGGRWFQASPEAKLTRIEFEGGNRRPMAVAAADKRGGIPPFRVGLSSAGTLDYDGDALRYEWELVDGGGNVERLEESNPTVTLDSVGLYLARLTVTDPQGLSDTRTVKIVSGNEPPRVDVHVLSNTQFFFPEVPVEYEVSIQDREDGSLKGGRIAPDRVSFSIDYTDAGFDVSTLEGVSPADAAAARFPVAQALIARGNCLACHLVDRKLVGPGFLEISRRYQGQTEELERLAQKIVTGGAGVWGPVAMPPNASIRDTEARTILKYIISLAEGESEGLPLAGQYVPQVQEAGSSEGVYVLRAFYEDLGDEAAPPLNGQAVKVLKSPRLSLRSAEEREGVEVSNRGMTAKRDSFLSFRGVDLTGVKELDLGVRLLRGAGHQGGVIEVWAGGLKGKLLGKSTVEVPEGDAPAAGGPRRFETIRVPIGVESVKGIHDLSLRFRNDAAQPGDSLMGLVDLTLRGVPSAGK